MDDLTPSELTNAKLERALIAPDQSSVASRWAFAILWGSAIVGLATHASDTNRSSEVVAAGSVLAALALWLHGVNKLHAVHLHGVSTRRTCIILAGAYAALAALLALDPAYLITLFGIYALTFVIAQGAVVAAIASLVVTAVWLGAWIAYELPLGAIVTPMLVWVTGNAISNAASRVTAQSEERLVLLEQVTLAQAELRRSERERGVLAERQRVADEIHDTLAQGFTSIVMLSEGLRRQVDSLPSDELGQNLGVIEQTARDNLGSARRLVENRPPAELEDGSLLPALKRLESTRSSAGPVVRFTTSGMSRPLGGVAEVAVLRIAQQAVANARTHADATIIDIDLRFGPDDVNLRIADNGSGFEVGAEPTPVAGVTGGRGLALMQDRAEHAHGVMTVETAPGQGTTVEATIPLPPLSTTECDA